MAKRGFQTADEAVEAAKAMGRYGLTGPGQICEPVVLAAGRDLGEAEGYWAFRTWDGCLILPEGEIDDPDEVYELYGSTNDVWGRYGYLYP